MAGKFTLNILGTASAKPNLKRASSAQLLQAAERLFLIDCSEDTQRRFLIQNMRLRKWCDENHIQGIKHISKTQLDSIFISHIHGDHMFGLFPLLSTMALNGRSKPLNIFGPNALGSVLTFYKSFWGDKDPFEIKFTPLKMKEPQVILEYPGITVEAFPLNHGIETFGFLFRESGQCLFKKEEYRPRSFAYCSDTAPFPELAQWVKGVDVLYHEGTYLAEDQRKAVFRMHSTTVDAATCAKEAGVGSLVVAHYSSAIKDEDVHGRYEQELQNIFPQSRALDDGDIIDIPLTLL